MEEPAYFQRFTDFVWLYGVKVLIALAILLVGIWLIRRLTRLFRNFLQRRRIDPSLRPFLVSMVDVGLKVVLLLVVANNVGLKTTSFIALFSAIALSIGLALQGSLGNFASGVLILLFRPYRVGDWLEVEGKKGHVAEIQMFNTILTAPDERSVIIPNGKMTQGIIEKIGARGEVRVDVTVTLANSADLPKLEEISDSIVANCPKAIHKKGAVVDVLAFTGEGVKALVGCWTTGQHYRDTDHALRRELKKAADAAGLEITVE